MRRLLVYGGRGKRQGMKKKVKIFNRIVVLSVTMALGLAFLSLLGGCNAKDVTVQKTYYLFDTQAALCLNGSQDSDFTKEVFQEAETVLSAIESSLNGENSDVAVFNRAAVGERVKIDQTTYTALSVALKMNAYTNGAYNAGVYYCVDLWGFTPRFKNYTGAVTSYDRVENSQLPQEKYITAFRELAAHFSDIRLEETEGEYYAVKPADGFVEVNGERYTLQVDLGGIGKGLAVDKIRELFAEKGIRYGYFSFGSSSLYAAERSDSVADWTVSFNNPRFDGTSSTYFSLKLSDCAVSTSGDYENYYETNGVRYSHIIDPRTGSPAQGGIMSASVIGGTAAEGDALTTALCAMDPTSAIEFINEKLTDKKVLLSYVADGAYKVAANFKGSVTDPRFTKDYKAEDGKILPKTFWERWGGGMIVGIAVVVVLAIGVGIYLKRKKKNVS